MDLRQGTRTACDGLREDCRVLGALAETLALHVPTLLLSDPAARAERDAYEALATAYREIATRLGGTAKQMASYRDLPMGAHDPKQMADPKLRAAFASYVDHEHDLITLLEVTVERDRKVLEQ